MTETVSDAPKVGAVARLLHLMSKHPRRVAEAAAILDECTHETRGRFSYLRAQGMAVNLNPPGEPALYAITRRGMAALEGGPEPQGQAGEPVRRPSIKEAVDAAVKIVNGGHWPAAHTLGEGSHIRSLALSLDHKAVASMIRATARAHGVLSSDITGHSRHAPICVARFHAWLIFKVAGFSYPAIGRAFGGRDHTTVLSGVRRLYTSMHPSELPHIVLDTLGDPV